MDLIKTLDYRLVSSLKHSLLDANYGEYALLLAVILSSSYVYNRGNPFEHLFFQQPQAVNGARSSASAATRNIGEKARENEAKIIILWGSQSGTAESLAHRLARDAQQRLRAATIACDLADYDPATLADVAESVIVVFIVSTYGEGDPSHNAIELVSHVTTLRTSPFSHLRYVAFGCGNSNYRYFNKAIDDIASSMDRCGAHCLVPTGKGDEASRSTQEDFLEWKEGFFSHLVSEYGMQDHKAEYQPTVSIIKEELTSTDSENMDNKSLPRKQQSIQIPIVSRDIVATYEGQDRSCIDLKLDLSKHSQIKYRTGDHIAIWPSNPLEEVDRLLGVLGLESQKPDGLRITVKDDMDELKVPSSTTIQALVSQHLDICAPVPRETVLALARLTSSAIVRTELESIGRDRETYARFLDHHHLNLGRLLELMNSHDPSNSWTQLPLAFVIDFIPAMQPRLYSIATSSTVDPRRVGIVVSVKPTSVLMNPKALICGVTSTYLSTADLSDISIETSLVRAEIRRSSFKLPVNLSIPVIMVAAGTGIAPFRAFIQERARLASIGHKVGPMTLFSGSQNRSDSLYHDELSALAATNGDKTLPLKFITAFSRPRESDGNLTKKTYVQDQVRVHSREVVDHLVDNDGAIYICGATTMAKAVGDVILEVLMQRNSWSKEAADKWRQNKRKTASWHEDVWS
ncbi:unnamed protein product [Clonostachys rosea]|uniref:NADPH--cytochrome P450 reductase n=1 Tax=Bionectria ochroleuca TaxID=29856 RepID=A0ABY6UL77_BIOOC|nr:unnamed protein product [Clonostachys rosea]